MENKRRPYRAYWNGQSVEVEATNSYNAQTAAFNLFRDKNPKRKIKAHDISVTLLDVTHSGASL